MRFFLIRWINLHIDLTQTEMYSRLSLRAAGFWFARHNAITGESPEHAWSTETRIAESLYKILSTSGNDTLWRVRLFFDILL